MRHRLPISLGRLFTALVALVVATTPAAAQNEDRPEPPRTSWGAPDLQGVWDYRTATPMERPRNYGDREFLTDEEAAAYEQQFSQRLDDSRRSPGTVADVERAYNEFWYDFGSNLTEDKRTSLIVDPPNGRIPPLTEEARLRATGPNESPLRERVIFRSGADGPEDRGLSERCILGFSSGPPLTPSAYNNNMQLFQTPDHVVIFTEMVHEARIIPLDGRPHLSRGLLQWLGDSRGHWDGDTLVIETVNFTDKASFTGTLGSRGGSDENLHLIERLTRLDADTLVYEFTVTDVTAWTRPWTAVIPLRRSEGSLFEYACHEGNHGMMGILSGARAEERAAAKAAAQESR